MFSMPEEKKQKTRRLKVNAEVKAARSSPGAGLALVQVQVSVE